MLASIVVIVLSLAAAIAVRRRHRSLTMTTFLLIAASFAISLCTRLIEDPDTQAKVGDFAIVLFLFGVIRLVLEGIDAATRRNRPHFSTIFQDLVKLGLWVVGALTVAYTV